tara:strand:+ start:10118 stop:10228 length:111 start_codon:yes stop_codon:yes gene_type:complete
MRSQEAAQSRDITRLPDDRYPRARAEITEVLEWGGR